MQKTSAPAPLLAVELGRAKISYQLKGKLWTCILDKARELSRHHGPPFIQNSKIQCPRKEERLSLATTVRHLLNHPLTRANKLAALMRFLRWQIRSRLVAGDVICPWVNGSKLVARSGESGVTGNLYCGLHEFADMAFLLHVLRGEDLFADVGANVGSYTVLACAAIGARGYCFEPVPSTYSRLMANIRANGLDERVVALNLALGNSRGQIRFSSDQNCANHVIASGENAGETISVAVSTLDEELKSAPFLMKIDVEGYETPMLEGAASTLGNEELCCVIMELNGCGKRYGYEEARILEGMRAHGFGTYSYEPFGRSLIDLGGKHPGQGNTLFVRNLDRVLERIRTAPKVSVLGSSL